MRKWNTPTDRAQRGDLENVVISLFIPKSWPLICQKLLIFYIFCWWQKKIFTGWGKHLTAPERSCWFFYENGIVNRL